MLTTTIRTLKSKVSREEAMRFLSSGGVSAIFRRLRIGRLRRIADAYVPFSLYRVRYEVGSKTHTRFFALDAVQGSLDLFEFPAVPEIDQLQTIHTRNFLRPSLEAARGEVLLYEKVLRVIFLEGFFKLREPKLEAVREPLELHLPYWLGFYGGRGPVRCRVMDAVRRRVEGAKASAFFEQWLAA